MKVAAIIIKVTAPNMPASKTPVDRPICAKIKPTSPRGHHAHSNDRLLAAEPDWRVACRELADDRRHDPDSMT
jgi:hypothetical protein